MIWNYFQNMVTNYIEVIKFTCFSEVLSLLNKLMSIASLYPINPTLHIYGFVDRVCNVNDIFPEKISLIYTKQNSPIHIVLSTIQRVLSVRSYILGNLQGVTISQVSFYIVCYV